MTFPASDVVRTNADAGTDSPATFRTDALDLIDKFNLLRNHFSALAQTLINRSTAALMRTDLGAAASGANGDITSLTALAAGGLPDNSVLTADIAALQVTGAKIAAATITPDKLTGAQSGSAPIFAARAWCVFDGVLTGTNAPKAGGNVSSVTRNSLGNYTINFTTAMADTNYSICATGVCWTTGNHMVIAGSGVAATGPTNKAVGSCCVLAWPSQTGLGDVNEVYVSIFR
jgi:hypothetical protein